jgi:hypothetical protein
MPFDQVDDRVLDADPRGAERAQELVVRAARGSFEVVNASAW